MQKHKILFLLFLFFTINCFAYDPPAVILSAINISPSATSTLFTFTLSEKTKGNIKYLPNPDRVIITLENTVMHFEIKKARLGGSNVKSITANSLGKELQFTLDVNGKVEWDIQFIPTTNKHTQLQIRINSSKNTPFEKPISNVISDSQLKQNFTDDLLKSFAEEVLTAQLATEQTPQDNNEENNKKTNIFTVVIDAGHGGKDPGAHGRLGTAEKDVVLAIANNLAVEINKTKYMRAVLTRDGDYFVPLRDRLKLARRGNADIFIAIHADAYFDNVATGASVYALSQNGATSEAARWLAQQDNYSELDGVELNTLKDHSLVLRSVLIDLAQTATTNESLHLGNKVLEALDKISSLHYTHIEQAPFVVLKSPDIPSILVETGFITNPKEEKRLRNPVYQTKLAHALFLGLKEYIGK